MASPTKPSPLDRDGYPAHAIALVENRSSIRMSLSSPKR
jgi:hypothetical protein